MFKKEAHMKRNVDLRAIIVRSSTGEAYTIFNVCNSMKSAGELPFGGQPLFSIPCGNIKADQPATIQCLLEKISKRAADYEIPLSKISGLKSFKHLASKKRME